MNGGDHHGYHNWEKATGAVRVRETTRAALLSIRRIGARGAKKRLADMAEQTEVKRRENGGVFPHGNRRRARGKADCLGVWCVRPSRTGSGAAKSEEGATP